MNCRRCHTCKTLLRTVLDGEEWCDTCGAWRRYPSHGWAAGACSQAERESKCLPRRVCAWCGKILAEGSEPVTHGICPECEAKVTPRSPR